MSLMKCYTRVCKVFYLNLGRADLRKTGLQVY